MIVIERIDSFSIRLSRVLFIRVWFLLADNGYCLYSLLCNVVLALLATILRPLSVEDFFFFLCPLVGEKESSRLHSCEN